MSKIPLQDHIPTATVIHYNGRFYRSWKYSSVNISVWENPCDLFACPNNANAVYKLSIDGKVICKAANYCIRVSGKRFGVEHIFLCNEVPE